MNWKSSLSTQGDQPLYRQLESWMRRAIEDGKLRPGERIPSVTELAGELGVNKVTVLRSFRELERDGLLSSHVGRGTFVANGSPRVASGAGAATATATNAAAGGSGARGDVARSIRRLRESYSRGLRELLSTQTRPGAINLSAGVPCAATIPDGTLERLAKKAMARHPERLYGYGGATGLPELREAIAARLTRLGQETSPDQVIITNGSQQAVTLAGCWALEEGRSILSETPTFTGMPGAFSLVGHTVESVAWEGAALSLGALRSLAGGRRTLLYVCPDFHNPTGQSLDEPARRALASVANQNDCVVLTDEIFRDLRFTGKPAPGLYGMLPPGRRILVGSISKSFMTGLRVGFLVADRTLLTDMIPSKRYMDLGGAALTQAIVAELLRDGYDEHLERVRAYYRVRCEAATEALEAELPDGVTFTRPEGGFQLWVQLPRGLSSIELFLLCHERGVSISPGPAHDIDGRYLNCFRVAYGHAEPKDLRVGIHRLGEAVRQLLVRGPTEGSATGLGVLV
ncbi:MAG: PLP-dependent aminotransferase family protein [Planctomycetes bacterium]|nr:PLP-dependent aminotransferase family protein [Planctomycetota bacterium]